MSGREAAARRSERINLRVEPEADELLRAAARAQHKSLSAFMVESALERAQQVMDAERRIVLQAVQAWRSHSLVASREDNRAVAGGAKQARMRAILVVSQLALVLPLLVAVAKRAAYTDLGT